MADYNDDSSYWDQYDAAEYVEDMVAVVQDPYTKFGRYRDILPNNIGTPEGSRDSGSSYWAKYAESRNTGAQDTPQEPTGQELQRVLVLPDRLAAMTLDDDDSESTGQPRPKALKVSSLNPKDTSLITKPDLVEVLSSPLRVPQLSDGEDSDEIGPIDSPSGPCFQGVNPLALAARLGFLKSQLEQAELLA
ncbi:hypothetical protein FBU59_001823 [Linderina macrospora]|uniref:Uncharacterized protein n=1 Tax=Linderina macrospora TaxID=4868 RepID=A0ACC1JCX9_9FUNG|nr:hypothetical protein FBU59_001823 [Linderina macrospora]